MLSILMIEASVWFETQEAKIKQINQKHLSDIKKLQKIGKINAWLDKVVKPLLIQLPQTKEQVNINLVKYFDTKHDTYHFSINKYLHKDNVATYLLNDFSIPRSDRRSLETFINIHYPQGFLQFQEFHIDKKKIYGKLLLIQPFYGENNVSH